MNYKSLKKIHFVGIKGAGMAPLAVLASQAGFQVTGSDVSQDFITKDILEAEKIKISGFSKENVSGVDLVVLTAAHGGFQNEEALEAKKNEIPVISQAEFLGIFQTGEIIGKKFEGICVSGCHGKTTTTAMIATILKNADLNPSFVIGTGHVPSLNGAGHLGKGKFFVCEADEYVPFGTPKFLYLKPKIAVVTNIDFDHPDVFKSITEVEAAFLKFTQNLTSGGVLIACGDGQNNLNFLKKCKVSKITYGFSPQNDYVISKLSQEHGKIYFFVSFKGDIIGQFSLNVFGEQNALNGLAAIIASMEAGVPLDKIKTGLSSYQGSQRRSQYIGKTAYGALLYDDYAHHPQEISKTIQAFKKNFPSYKIVPVFQPHMYSRTKLLFDDFVKSFDNCESVIITEVFPSFRENRDDSFSAKLLSDAINKRRGNSHFFSQLSDVIKYFDQNKYGADTLLITMGAGDIYTIGDKLLN